MRRVFLTWLARHLYWEISDKEMVRPASLFFEDEEAHDSSSQSDSRRVDRKVNASRSKHSETEQRRRSKINERFQVLRDLIPENDQKRDKASLLLEVIQYIQFLQEKLRTYEGSGQGWSQELSKFLPWRIYSGPVELESFGDQSQHDRNSSDPEDNVVLHPVLLNDGVGAELTGSVVSKSSDNPSMSRSSPPLNMHIFESLSGQQHEGPFPNTEQFNQQTQLHELLVRSRGEDCTVPICPENEEPVTNSGEASTSKSCSQRLLDNLVEELRSSGVDLSQASISVQLDIGKQVNADEKQAHAFGLHCGGHVNGDDEDYTHPRKKFRAD